MNSSNFYHGLLAVCIQCVIALLGLLAGMKPEAALGLGAAFAVGFYFGREVEQVECKNGRDPWWVGFNPSKWSTDNALDLAFPIVFCTAVYAAACLIFEGA